MSLAGTGHVAGPSDHAVSCSKYSAKSTCDKYIFYKPKCYIV